MPDLSVYKSIPDVKSIDDVLAYFLKTLLPTNRRWSFYVNWKKVADFVSKFKVEIGILGAVLRSSDEEFAATIKKYPDIVKIFPRLIAVRDDQLSILDDPAKRAYLDYDFTNLPKTDAEVERYVNFWKNSGLADALRDIKNLHDYYFGVEVGSDTNARKNRGGTEWEGLVEPLIQSIAKKNGYQVEVRQKFDKVMKKLGYKVPRELERNIDFLVYKDSKFVDIEANFFAGSGTKLEVPGAYVNRNFSEKFSLSFILFTDGLGWTTAKPRIQEFFEKFPCVVNYQMARNGILENGLKNILK